MVPLPNYRPKQLSLGPLETEILHLIWELGTTTAREIHDRILSDPDRELTYSSVITVLSRLVKKGWLTSHKRGKILFWQAAISRPEAQALEAHERLNRFLEVGNADIVAAFADELDLASVDRLEAIAQRLKAIRQEREER
ncbi:BlaI/MecI/CopY family transcriptional regulator [Pseudanabaena sp. PCC 6802]|uniref:BlaI/MecI/CopY family transcriptional regulator n=1 Tax=Pseudanabaena sp. PCC 6802 TaxID=118173 RepID=UPI0003465468|nr:BlaI/MecI/CopY family transcriptional regulator [Pseudanabaena sp. PCC 6802]